MAKVMTHRVRYHEADAQGFLFNGRYLEIADVAMTEFFRDLGLRYGDMVARGMDPSVVRAELTFSKPARFDELLDVDVTCTRVGTSSFDLRTVVSHGGIGVAEMNLVYVNVDTVTARSQPIPADMAAQLAHAQEAAESGLV